MSKNENEFIQHEMEREKELEKLLHLDGEGAATQLREEKRQESAAPVALAPVTSAQSPPRPSGENVEQKFNSKLSSDMEALRDFMQETRTHQAALMTRLQVMEGQFTVSTQSLSRDQDLKPSSSNWGLPWRCSDVVSQKDLAGPPPNTLVAPPPSKLWQNAPASSASPDSRSLAVTPQRLPAA